MQAYADQEMMRYTTWVGKNAYRHLGGIGTDTPWMLHDRQDEKAYSDTDLLTLYKQQNK